MSRALRWMLLGALLLAVALPRFNLHDPGPIKRFTASATATPYGLPLDVEGYIRLADYFRGQTPADSLLPPFCFRPLVPFAASLIPLDSQTSINLINIASLFLTLIVLGQILKLVGYSERARLIGSLLFIVSFPTFYYGTIGFVDPPSVFLVALGVYWSLLRRYLLIGIAVLVGVLVKETNALIALFPLIHAWANREVDARVWGLTLAFLLLAGVAVLGFRIVAPFPEAGYFWIPRLRSIAENISRPRAVLSLVLTLGLPGALALMSMIGGRAGRWLRGADYRFFLGGSALGSCLYAYSLTSAYADGRVIWIIYPFVIPLALACLEAPGALARYDERREFRE